MPDLLAHILWVDPPDDATRFWCIDLALRCKGVSAVVADATRMDMAGSRRFQLAAEAGNTVGLLARPATERRILSAAATRWLITPEPTPLKRPRWTVELLRRKGVRPTTESPRRFVVEWDHAQSAVALPPDLARGPLSPARESEGAGVGGVGEYRLAG